jgi:hypothetical protein
VRLLLLLPQELTVAVLARNRSGVRAAIALFTVATGFAGLRVTAEQPGSPQTAAETSDQRAALQGWAQAANEWVSESPRGGDPRLARGVLLECLASPRGQVVPAALLPREEREACGAAIASNPAPGRVITQYLTPKLNYGCSTGAEREYRAALSRNPDLAEARVRLAFLALRRGDQPGSQDERALAGVGQARADTQLAYLSSMSLGLLEERRHNPSGAAAHYERARAIGPGWPSASYAIAAMFLQQRAAEQARDLLVAKTSSDRSDPWYRYSCEVITASVATELERRLQRQRGR